MARLGLVPEARWYRGSDQLEGKLAVKRWLNVSMLLSRGAPRSLDNQSMHIFCVSLINHQIIMIMRR